MITATASPNNRDDQGENEERRNQFIAIWAEAAARVLESARDKAQVYAEGRIVKRGRMPESQVGQAPTATLRPSEVAAQKGRC